MLSLNRLGWWFLCGIRACFHSVKCFKMKQAVWNQHEHLLPADWLLLSGGCFESLSLYFYALWKQKTIGMMWIVVNGPDFFFLSLPTAVGVQGVNETLCKKNQHLYPLNNALNAVLCSLKRPPYCSTHIISQASATSATFISASPPVLFLPFLLPWFHHY